MAYPARLLICIFFVGLILYKYIDKLNELTELQLNIPQIAKEVKEIKEKNLELQYEIEQFESPIHLMELSRKPEFGHLKHPAVDKIIFLPDASLQQPNQNLLNQ